MLLEHYKAINFQNDKIILVTFDSVCLFLLSPFLIFKKRKIVAIVHNNLEFASNNKAHYLILYFLSLFIEFVFIAEYLKDRANKLGISGQSIDFILNNYKESNSFKTNHFKKNSVKQNNAFVHGRCYEKTILNARIDWSVYENVYCNNPNYIIPFVNWTCKYFTDLNIILKECDDFYFLNKVNFRQYSIIFEILKIPNVTILVNDILLYKYLIDIVSFSKLHVRIELLK